jgi:CheY-like chemotaxis protein
MKVPAPQSAPRPRVLLVEDDAAIRRFVAMALEDCDLDLVEAPTIHAAIAALHGPPLALVLCDLMLPDGSGLDLLQTLVGPGSPCPGVRRVAFSAGISGEVRQRLQSIGVTEILTKPVSVAALVRCVDGALVAAASNGVAAEKTPAAPDPVASYFGGDQDMFDRFMARCRLQWPRDAAQGDLAVRASDLATLRRLAHSAKSVLATLGLEAESALALGIEQAAGAGRSEAACALWPALRARLLLLAAAGADPERRAPGAPAAPGA